MKKTTKNELTNRIRDLMDDFWVGLLDVVDPGCSFDELPRDSGIPEDVEEYVSKRVMALLDNNGFVTDGDLYTATAYYTGGGIWISAKYIDDIHYAVVSNCDDDFVLSYYELDDDEREYDDIFPCINMTRSVSLEEMTKDDLILWKELKTALDEAK